MIFLSVQSFSCKCYANLKSSNLLIHLFANLLHLYLQYIRYIHIYK